MAYATLDDLKQYLGIGTSTADDALLTELLNRATDLVRTFTGREFAAVAGTRKYMFSDAFQGRILYLDEDLASLTQVVNGDGTDITAKVQVWPPNAKPPYWALWIPWEHADTDWTWTEGRSDKAVQVTGLWGYSQTPPDAVKHATIRLAAWLYRQKDTSADLDRPLLTNDGVVIMPGALPKDIQQMLAPYRRLV